MSYHQFCYYCVIIDGQPEKFSIEKQHEKYVNQLVNNCVNCINSLASELPQNIKPKDCDKIFPTLILKLKSDIKNPLTLVVLGRVLHIVKNSSYNKGVFKNCLIQHLNNCLSEEKKIYLESVLSTV